MAKAYTADVAAAPDKRRFMFAYTNAEVDALNQYARVIHQRRGDLGAAVGRRNPNGRGIPACPQAA